MVNENYLSNSGWGKWCYLIKIDWCYYRTWCASSSRLVSCFLWPFTLPESPAKVYTNHDIQGGCIRCDNDVNCLQKLVPSLVKFMQLKFPTPMSVPFLSVLVSFWSCPSPTIDHLFTGLKQVGGRFGCNGDACPAKLDIGRQVAGVCDCAHHGQDEMYF